MATNRTGIVKEKEDFSGNFLDVSMHVLMILITNS